MRTGLQDLVRLPNIFPRVNQGLGVNQLLRVTPKCWKTPIFYFLVFPFVTEKDVKMLKTMISNSKGCAKHSLAGQNTPQTYFKPLMGSFWLSNTGRTDKLSMGCFSIHPQTDSEY